MKHSLTTTLPCFFSPVANACFQALFCTARPVGDIGLSSLAICPHLHVAAGKTALMTCP